MAEQTGGFVPDPRRGMLASIPRPGTPFLVVIAAAGGAFLGLAGLHHWLNSMWPDWTAHAEPDQHASRLPAHVVSPPPGPPPEEKAPPPEPSPPPVAAQPLPEAQRAAAAVAPAPNPKPPRKIGYQVSYQPRENPDLIEGRTVNPAPACTLLPGQDIKAELVDRVVSEVPGTVTARVTEPVFAEAAGADDGPLLPIGTKLVGSYKQTRLDPSRRRLDFGWQYAELPDGRTVRLGDAFGQDMGGAAGVAGKVDMHWGQLWLTGLILVTTGAVEYGTNSTAAAGGGIADAIGASAGREGGNLARQTAARTLNLEPTITIRPGALITVRPKKMVRVC